MHLRFSENFSAVYYYYYPSANLANFSPLPPKKWSTSSEKILTHFDSKEKGRTRYFFSFRVPPLCTLYSWVNKTENDIWPHWWKEKCSLFKYSILFIWSWALVKPCCEEFWSRWKMNSKNVSKYLIFCDLHGESLTFASLFQKNYPKLVIWLWR